MCTVYLHPIIASSPTATKAYEKSTGLTAFILSKTIVVLKPLGSAPILTLKPKTKPSTYHRPPPTGPFNGGGHAA